MPRPYTASKREEVLAEVALLELQAQRKNDNSIGVNYPPVDFTGEGRDSPALWSRKSEEKKKEKKARGRPCKLSTTEREALVQFLTKALFHNSTHILT
jgi:hypothetical protein